MPFYVFFSFWQPIYVPKVQELQIFLSCTIWCTCSWECIIRKLNQSLTYVFNFKTLTISKKCKRIIGTRSNQLICRKTLRFQEQVDTWLGLSMLSIFWMTTNSTEDKLNNYWHKSTINYFDQLILCYYYILFWAIQKSNLV